MIYCREKLIDVILESRWISLEERFDLDIIVEKCLSIGHFSQQEWVQTFEFLAGCGNFTSSVAKVIDILTNELSYTDDKFTHDKSAYVKAVYAKLEKGVRL